MKKLLVAAGLSAAVAMQACAGHSGSSFVPSAQPQSASSNSIRGIAPAGIAPGGFDTTATGRMVLPNAADAGRLAPESQVTVHVVMKLRNKPELDALIASHRVISRDEFVAQFGPSRADVQGVESYLRSKKLSSLTVEPNQLIVSASGRARDVEAAFATELHAFSMNGKQVYANVKPAFVPKTLHGSVASVVGLTNANFFQLNPLKTQHLAAAPRPRPASTQAPSACSLYGVEIVGFPSPEPDPNASTLCTRNYYPDDFQRAYDTVGTANASSVAIAIMAEGNVTQSIADLRTNEKHDMLAPVPVIVKQVGVASSDTAGADEWTLDMTASSGIAGYVKAIYLYTTTSLTDSDITLEYSHWVSDDLAKIGNSSFGGCEAGPFVDGSMVAMDELMNEGAAQGQTMFASTGDTGSFCPEVAGENGVPAGAPMVNYPAASPYAVAVGGTTLITQSNGSYQGEAAWYSGGGGLSQFEYAPTWEASEQPVASKGESFRGLPDIAMDADLQTGMILYITGSGWSVIGGTSLASPLAAGSWARVAQHGVQYAPPALYATYVKNAAGSTQNGPPATTTHGAFHDVIAGANGAYTALPGYDYVSGLGSLDVKLLIGQL